MTNLKSITTSIPKVSKIEIVLSLTELKAMQKAIKADTTREDKPEKLLFLLLKMIYC